MALLGLRKGAPTHGETVHPSRLLLERSALSAKPDPLAEPLSRRSVRFGIMIVPQYGIE